MKSIKNLTRFNYNNAAFEGWRLCMSRSGTTFTKYFSDKKFGGGKESFVVAQKALAELKKNLENVVKIDGKLELACVKFCEDELQKF